MAILVVGMVLGALATWYITRLAYHHQLRKMQMKTCLHQVEEVFFAFRIIKGYWAHSAAELHHEMRVDYIKSPFTGEPMRIVDVPGPSDGRLQDCIGFYRSISIMANEPWSIALSGFDRMGAVVERIETVIRDEATMSLTRPAIKTTLEVAAMQA